MLAACSAWFADAAWAALGLPDAWLHTFYQAVLAPVRGLWHVWPHYQAYYAYAEETHDLAAASTDLFGLMVILAQAAVRIAADLAAPTLSVLAAPAAVVLAACGVATKVRQGEVFGTRNMQPTHDAQPGKINSGLHSAWTSALTSLPCGLCHHSLLCIGTPLSVRRTASQAVPLLVVLGICLLVCVAQGARIEGMGERWWVWGQSCLPNSLACLQWLPLQRQTTCVVPCWILNCRGTRCRPCTSRCQHTAC